MVCDRQTIGPLLCGSQVLILILLEYGLRRRKSKERDKCSIVLILILLEYGLRPVTVKSLAHVANRLNPYSIGIWSATTNKEIKEFVIMSLNPYSIGIWSATEIIMIAKNTINSLNPYSIGIWSATSFISHQLMAFSIVLILILLEYGLRL